MNLAAPLKARIGLLACLLLHVLRVHVTGVADPPAIPLPSEPAVAPAERTPNVPSIGAVLRPDLFRHHVEAFNRLDRETVVNHIPNAEAWDWLARNVPLLECPDRDLEEIYYFRWWTYRKHVKQTPDGFIITEFLPPVPWAGKHNSINCPAGHHFYEGRWLHDPRYLDDYARFWFRGGGEPRKYSFWAADAIYARSLVEGDTRLPRELLPDLIANYQAWEASHLDESGLFWQNDGNDGMEVSIGGSGCRATINSYQYGDALAISRIAELDGQPDLARAWREKAATLKALVQSKLWDPQAQFYLVLPRGQSTLANVRELHGYTPWYFNLPDAEQAVAWRQLMDPLGFYAPFGPTTAEQRHPGFAVNYHGHECQWNGPSWPLATSVTLTALANLLNHYSQDVVTKADYWSTLQGYVRSHRFRQFPPGATNPSEPSSLSPASSGGEGRLASPKPPGEGGGEGVALERIESRQPWIDENLNPFNGDWIARTLLKQRRQPPDERGKDYNHSTFCDLIITGVVGLRPRPDDLLELNPLVPEGAWDWFCLDRVRYHGRQLTVLWDRDGTKYRRGAGLQLFVDGQRIARADRLERMLAPLPRALTPGQWTPAQAWTWYEQQPWLVGCNFLPSTAVNDVAMWQADTFDPPTIDRELGWAASLGFNTVRVFLNYVVWEADAAGFKSRLARFLEIAQRHGIVVMPILFDDCNFAGRVAAAGPQPDPVPGVHNSQWVSSPPLKMVDDPAAWPRLKRYAQDIVGAFARDPRVVAWDLYNEPGNGMGETSRPLMEATFAWAREIQPLQPLTIGAWTDFDSAFSRRMLELSDVVSFHGYDPLPGIEAKLKICRESGRPVLCTEWMARTLDSRFESHLPWFRTHRIACWSWGLVAGRTQTFFPWGSPKDAPEPELWFHDLFRPDGSPYLPQEVQFIRRTLGLPPREKPDRAAFQGPQALAGLQPAWSAPAKPAKAGGDGALTTYSLRPCSSLPFHPSQSGVTAAALQDASQHSERVVPPPTLALRWPFTAWNKLELSSSVCASGGASYTSPHLSLRPLQSRPPSSLSSIYEMTSMISTDP